jgi:hypothetical protein
LYYQLEFETKMLSTLFSRKKELFLDQVTISCCHAKAKCLKARVDKCFNLVHFVDLAKIATEAQDSIGTTQKLQPCELLVNQILNIWGRTKEGYNRTAIGTIPSSKTIFIGGFNNLPLDSIENYSTSLVRDIDIIFELKDHYQPVLQEALELIISNLETLAK